MTGKTTTYRSLVRESVCLARALQVLLKDIEDEDKAADSSVQPRRPHRDSGSKLKRSAPAREQPPASWSKDLRMGTRTVQDILVDRVEVQPGLGPGPAETEVDQASAPSAKELASTATGMGTGGEEKKRQQDNEAHDEVVVGVFVENRVELVKSLVANLLIGVPVTMLNPLANTGR